MKVAVLLENCAGEGDKLVATFDELASVINALDEPHRARVGVCLDTCHLFAAGYDISTQEGYTAVMSEARFDAKARGRARGSRLAAPAADDGRGYTHRARAQVGLRYLRALHLNDSAGPLGCRADRHANLGAGHIGLQAFRCIMNDPRLDGVPLLLETPAGAAEGLDVYRAEVSALYALEGCDDIRFAEIEADLAARLRELGAGGGGRGGGGTKKAGGGGKRQRGAGGEAGAAEAEEAGGCCGGGSADVDGKAEADAEVARRPRGRGRPKIEAESEGEEEAEEKEAAAVAGPSSSSKQALAPAVATGSRPGGPTPSSTPPSSSSPASAGTRVKREEEEEDAAKAPEIVELSESDGDGEAEGAEGEGPGRPGSKKKPGRGRRRGGKARGAAAAAGKKPRQYSKEEVERAGEFVDALFASFGARRGGRFRFCSRLASRQLDLPGPAAG
eukprot:tig00020675_g12602.t1